MLSYDGLNATLSGFSMFNDRIQGFRYAPPLAKYFRPYRATYSEKYEQLVESCIIFS